MEDSQPKHIHEFGRAIEADALHVKGIRTVLVVTASGVVLSGLELNVETGLIEGYIQGESTKISQ